MLLLYILVFLCVLYFLQQYKLSLKISLKIILLTTHSFCSLIQLHFCLIICSYQSFAIFFSHNIYLFNIDPSSLGRISLFNECRVSTERNIESNKIQWDPVARSFFLESRIWRRRKEEKGWRSVISTTTWRVQLDESVRADATSYLPAPKLPHLARSRLARIGACSLGYGWGVHYGRATRREKAVPAKKPRNGAA